ncbi:hypothetical protein OPIT5_22315 [Opitutaceae bacterium TAV5]|nr:hypothetical protein OPIT5_22315 [Opitutaceae bacterium TAV5]
MTSTTQLNNEGLVLDVIIDGAAAFAYDCKSPRLILPIQLKQVGKEPANIVYELGTLYGVLRCGTQHVSEANPEPIEQMAQYGARHIQFTFQLNHEKLNWLEEMRAGTGQMSFSLCLKITVRKLGIIPQPQNQPQLQNQAFVYLKGFTCHSSEVNVHIPRDRWISSLEATNFGAIHVFEFPRVPLEYRETLKNAFAALKEAKHLHLMGFYDKAIGECRIALDKFWDERPKRLKDEWKTYMGAGAHVWLDQAFTAIRRGSNEPHHNAGLGHDQFESLVFINLTASLVAHVARMGVKESQTTK